MQKWIISLLSTYLKVLNKLSSKLGGRHAFLLFCYPFPLKLKKHQSQFLATGRASTFYFEGKKIRMYKWGSGDKVVLCLHGWQSNSFRWKKYIESIDLDRFTIICLDAPAHGQSEGRYLNVLMYSRLIELFLYNNSVDYIIGHSLGAFSSMYLFSQKPALSTHKLVALGTPNYVDYFIDEFIRILDLSVDVKTNMYAHIKRSTNQLPVEFDSKIFAKKQVAQGLIIHDEEDRDVPFEYAKSMASLWPNASFMGTKGFGHKLRDDSIVQAVIDFIDADASVPKNRVKNQD